MRKFALCVLLICVAATAAHANVYHITIAGCVPNDTTIRQGLYQITDGRLEFKPTATGSIVFNCIIPVPITAPSTVSLTAKRDNSNATVGVTYTAMIKGTGGPIGDNTTVTLSTNSSSAVVTTGAITNSYSQANIYYISVGMSRQSTSHNPVFYSATVY